MQHPVGQAGDQRPVGIQDARHREVGAEAAVTHRGAVRGEPAAQIFQLGQRPRAACHAGRPPQLAVEAARRVGHLGRPQLPALPIHHGVLVQHRQPVGKARERPTLTHLRASGAAAFQQQALAAGGYRHHGGLHHVRAGEGDQRPARQAQVAGTAHVGNQLQVGAGGVLRRQAQGAGRRRPGHLGAVIQQRPLQLVLSVAQAAALVHRQCQQSAFGRRHHVDEQRRPVAGAPAPALHREPHLTATGRVHTDNVPRLRACKARGTTGRCNAIVPGGDW